MHKATVAFIVLFAAAMARGNTYTVTSTNDSGAGSLRQALLDANANPGADTIAFAVSGAGCDGNGVCTITPQTYLPLITSPVTIDGYTQTGATPNTNTSGAINAVLKIVVSGVNDPNHGDDSGLTFRTGSDGSVVKGLVVNDFAEGIEVWPSNVGVQGCFLGTDAAGMAAVGQPGETGLYGFGPGGASALSVGGSQAADRNLIVRQVHLQAVAGATIEGNLIGTDKTGAAAFPTPDPAYESLLISPVGGTTIVRGNVVGGGAMSIGENLAPSAFPTFVYGNFVGTDVTGTVNLGGAYGILVGTTDVTVGGTGPGEGNVIAFCGFGVYVYSSARRVTIRGNSIYSTAPSIYQGPELNPYAAAGIHFLNNSPPLFYMSPWPNDYQDVDSGPNDGQNSPVISSVASSIADAGTTTVTGLLNSTPGTNFTLDFYATETCVHWPRSYVEGKTYLGSAPVTTDVNGDAPFSVILAATLEPGAGVTATATDPAGNTSEFSQRIVFHSEPGAGNPAGVAGAHVYGSNFLPGATLKVGGIPAPSVVVNDYYTVTFNTPSLSPGTVYDVVLTNTDGTTGTLPSGWVADFTDVPDGTPFWSYVTVLVKNKVTAGVGGGLYGLDQPTKRQQMAVFLLKGRHGLCYTPPPCTGVFADVPCPSTFANWIEALKAEGITGGCGGPNYCPDSPVRRDQMAVFLLKAEHGPSYVPPSCTGVFGDVSCPGQFSDWIERLAAEGITSGCGGGNYCPLNPNTRGQMAVFLGITFNLFH
jgi:hypothetical protein